MIPFRRGPNPPVATPDDGRNKVVVRYARYAESPIEYIHDGIAIYTDSRTLSGSSNVYPMEELFYEYDGTEDVLYNDGINAVIDLLSKKYKVAAFPLGCASHGYVSFYIGGVRPGYGGFDSGCIGVMVLSKDYKKRGFTTEEMAEYILEQLSDYMNGEVYEYELIDGKGNEIEISGHYYGDDEFVEAVVDGIKSVGWKDFVIVTEGDPSVSEYIEEDILKALGKEPTRSANRRPSGNASRTKKATKTKSTSSKKKKPIEGQRTTKRTVRR